MIERYVRKFLNSKDRGCLVFLWKFPLVGYILWFCRMVEIMKKDPGCSFPGEPDAFYGNRSAPVLRKNRLVVLVQFPLNR